MTRLLPALAALFLVPTTLFAQRQEILALSADVINLEQQVREIQRTLDQRNNLVQDLMEQMYEQFVILTETVDRVSETVGAIQVSNDRLSGELRAEIANLGNDLELMDLGFAEVRAAVTAISQQMTSLSATTEELDSPFNLLRTAQTDLTIGYLDSARDGFIEFLRAFPGHPDAAAAQLGLGNSYYDAGAYDLAIIEYDLLLQRYEGSANIPDALLRKGRAHLETGSDADARDAFERLVTMFPETSQGLQAQEELDALAN